VNWNLRSAARASFLLRRPPLGQHVEGGLLLGGQVLPGLVDQLLTST